jgi:hypothetical protein
VGDVDPIDGASTNQVPSEVLIEDLAFAITPVRTSEGVRVTSRPASQPLCLFTD